MELDAPAPPLVQLKAISGESAQSRGRQIMYWLEGETCGSVRTAPADFGPAAPLRRKA